MGGAPPQPQQEVPCDVGGWCVPCWTFDCLWPSSPPSLHASLAPSFSQVLSDFASERASVVAAASSQVSEAAGKVDALHRLLRLKGRELQQLRQLGQEVLQQRSEVEIFLLSSLHQVRVDVHCEA